jgi:hypothetical protein
MCGAHARTTGSPCKAKALRNGRCRNHGGCSTGPKTERGRQAIAEATRQRMASGQRIKALAGFRSWLDAGGRVLLSNMAVARERRKRWLRSFPHASRGVRLGVLSLAD